MGGQKKYIEMFGSFADPFNFIHHNWANKQNKHSISIGRLPESQSHASVPAGHSKHANINKLCAWRHNMPLFPASITIISCQRLPLFTTEFAKTNYNINNKHCAILPSLCRHCQSKAKHSRMGAGYAFLPIIGYLCATFGLPRPLCSRPRPDVHDRRQTYVRKTDVRQHHRLMPPPIRGGGIMMA